MISRRRTNTPPNEVLQQASITGAAGIDITRPITANNVSDKSVNLDLDYDGSLILRKPLIEKNTYNWLLLDSANESIVTIKYLYDKKHRLVIIKNVDPDTNTIKYAIVIVDEAFTGWVKYNIRFTDILGADVDILTPIEYDASRVSYWNLENPKIFNTNTATIIGNCTVDLTKNVFAQEKDPGDNVIHEAIYNPALLEETYAKAAPRYLQVFYEITSQQWVVRIVTPEINNLALSETVILNPNTTLDSSYALRDNYFASLPSVKGVLAYANTFFQNEKLVYNPEVVSTDYESDLVNQSKYHLNPVYWNPGLFNLNDLPSNIPVVFGTDNLWKIGVRWDFDSVTPKIPLKAIKNTSFFFNIVNGQFKYSTIGNGGTIPHFWSDFFPVMVETDVGRVNTITPDGSNVKYIHTEFEYIKNPNTTLSLNDSLILENGNSFRAVCTDNNGYALWTYNWGSEWTRKIEWHSCGMMFTLRINLKDGTYREFLRWFGNTTT